MTPQHRKEVLMLAAYGLFTPVALVLVLLAIIGFTTRCLLTWAGNVA